MTEDHIGRAVPGWQGMDSAPKPTDGRMHRILIAPCWGGDQPTGEAWWRESKRHKDGGWWETGMGRAPLKPTAWMPLPDPPEVTG